MPRVSNVLSPHTSNRSSGYPRTSSVTTLVKDGDHFPVGQPKNQWKPNPPREWLEPFIEHYWTMGISAKKMFSTIKKHHLSKCPQWGLGETKWKELLKEWGYWGVRLQNHKPSTIRDAMLAVRQTFPKAGIRECKRILLFEHRMVVSRSCLEKYFQEYEPEGIKERKHNRLRRKIFWCAGVNDLLVFDQHDKWKYKFGLCLHIGLDPYIGHIKWLKVWWNNSNPRLILKYYLDWVEEVGYTTLVTQSDPGSENHGIARGHSMLRQLLDPSLKGTFQHRWKRKPGNLPPEIAWSVMRRMFSPGFEDMMDEAVHSDLYNPANTVENLLFRYLVIPYMQAELDAYRTRRNKTAKRHDKNKVLPHGVPEMMLEFPLDYGAMDFRIPVSRDKIDIIRKVYLQDQPELFELVPASFAHAASQVYKSLGCPEVNRSTLWTIFETMLRGLNEQLPTTSQKDQEEWSKAYEFAEQQHREPSELAEDSMPRILVDLPEPICSEYGGGLNGGRGYDLDEWERIRAEAVGGLPLANEPSEFLILSSDDETMGNEDDGDVYIHI